MSGMPPGYSRVDYLNKMGNQPIPSTTVGKDVVVALTVPQGQWWMPKLVRIGLQSSNPAITVGGVLTTPGAAGLFNAGVNVPQFQLYQGGATNNTIQATPYLTPNQGLYLDGTLDGTADSTGVVSGTILFPGDTLIGVWRNVNAPMDINGALLGSQALMQVIGLVSNIPPNSASFDPTWVPSISGVHFSGKPTQPTVTEATSVTSMLFTPPGPGNTVTILSGLPPALKLWYMEWAWAGSEPTANQTTGTFQLRQGATVVTTLNTDTASVSAKMVDFHGAKVSLYGAGSSDLVFKEDPASGVLAGTIDCSGTFVYSVISPLP